MANDAQASGGQEAQIRALIEAGQLGEAATRCAEAGEHEQAAALFERACDFPAATEQALAGRDLARAMRLAVLSSDATLCQRILDELVTADDPRLAGQVAADLESRGQHRLAGQLYSAVDEHQSAAQAFERAGAPLEAAECFERAGSPPEAARTLETALRADGVTAVSTEPPDRLRVALGRLYLRHARHEPAVRVLQQIPPESEFRRDALAPLAECLEHLGLPRALSELESEMARLGVSAEPARAGSDPADPEGGRLYGRYQVEREVAVTPHARLVQAIDGVTGERVAVKILASQARGTGRDAVQRFEREARALSQLRHPNVVPLRDFIPEGPAMVLAWMTGGSLRDLIDREPISPTRAAEIARGVLGALAQAHTLGILHRDIKPSNLLFDDGGTAKLADFGAAHLAESEATVTAAEIGTVAYMSPEQTMGRAATVRSDLYSVGVLLHEMLCGELPDGQAKPSAAHPDLESAHDRLVARLLAERPEDRYESATEADDAIAALTWSTRQIGQPSRRRQRPAEPKAPSATTGHARLTPARRPQPPDSAGAIHHDAWLARDVLLLAGDEATLHQARAFARAGHAALPLVLRVDDGDGQIWIEPAPGQPLAGQQAALSSTEVARLEGALTALHRAGGAHGFVDPDHIYRHCGTVYLAFPRQLGAGDATSDQAALARLSG